MYKPLLAGIAVLATVTALAQAPEIQPIAARLNADALKADVSFLASDALEGRGTPSRGLDIAAEYIAAEFRRAGLEPAAGEDYFQNAAFESVKANLEGLEFSLEAGGRTVKVGPAAMRLQEPAPASLDHVGAVKAALAELDGLTAAQVDGKALVVDVAGGGRGGAFRAVRRLGTSGLKPAIIVLLQSDAPRMDVSTRVREATGKAAIPTLVVWDAPVRQALAEAKEAAVTVHIAAPIVTPVKLRNVAGVLRGSDPALQDTYLVLTAHYDHLGVRGAGPGDHIYNGANDDASGTSSVIEIAKALAALPERPRRSILFMAFFGEELGDVGSAYYCRHPLFPPEKTIAEINLEHMGRTDDDEGRRLLQFNLTGFDYTDLAPVFAKAGEETGINVVKHETNSDAFFGRSDNAAFAEAGIPSTTISVTYTFPDYHRPGDEWPKLDYENMAKVDRAVALGILRLANSAATPQWNRENPKTAQYVRAREAATNGSRPQ
ncbi:MAG TPA: M28 family peptidase [Bryobacteraceae bacterium]